LTLPKGAKLPKTIVAKAEAVTKKGRKDVDAAMTSWMLRRLTTPTSERKEATKSGWTPTKDMVAEPLRLHLFARISRNPKRISAICVGSFGRGCFGMYSL